MAKRNGIFSWLFGTTQPQTRAPRARLRLESLESREVPTAKLFEQNLIDLAPPIAAQQAVLRSNPVAAALAAPTPAVAAANRGWFGVDPARDGVYAKPYRYIGKIYTFWKDGSIRQGTGFLVGKSHVLTAGHVLYDINKRQSPVAVMFTPGEYYGRAPVGSANGVKWAVAQPFLNGNSYYDYGVVKLNQKLGERTLGWFALQDWEKGWAYEVQIAGYAGGWNEGRSMLMGRARTQSALRYPDIRWKSDELRPLGGLSGSPLFFPSGGGYRVVGIYTTGDAFGIGGVKLTPQIRSELQGWINRNP